MFAWLKKILREHELPENPSAPVRVDFQATVVSPNTVKSPVTDFISSLVEVALYDREIRNESDMLMAADAPERERFILLGAIRLGSLVVEDQNGRRLYIDDSAVVNVIPLSGRPIDLDTPLTGALAEFAKRSQHLLTVRETRFREKDTVRVRATVELRERVVAGGYRDAVERILVPVRGEPLVLREML